MTPLTQTRIEEAAAKARARAEVIREYLEYLYRVSPGEMGMLTCHEGETTREVRRNLSLAAVVAGEPIDIALRRKPRAVCFWLKRRRGGRPRKAG